MSRIDTFVDGAVLSPSPSRPGAITVQPGWSRNARADRERSGRLRLWRVRDSMTCAGRRGLRSFTFSSESINGGRTRTRSRSLSVVSRSGCRLSGRRIGGVRCRLTGSCGWSRCRAGRRRAARLGMAARPCQRRMASATHPDHRMARHTRNQPERQIRRPTRATTIIQRRSDRATKMAASIAPEPPPTSITRAPFGNS